jgi:hypothetical protein
MIERLLRLALLDEQVGEDTVGVGLSRPIAELGVKLQGASDMVVGLVASIKVSEGIDQTPVRERLRGLVTDAARGVQSSLPSASQVVPVTPAVQISAE